MPVNNLVISLSVHYGSFVRHTFMQRVFKTSPNDFQFVEK